jgi:hypothetical protein
VKIFSAIAFGFEIQYPALQGPTAYIQAITLGLETLADGKPPHRR